MSESIRVERHGAVGVITIARRERFNSLDVETAQELRKAGLRCARDAELRVVVLRGDGGVFCSGAALKYIRAGGNAEDLGYLQEGRETPKGYGAIFQQILGFREFVTRVDKDRLERMGGRSPERFERVLPYALVLGAADVWAEAFDGLYREPPRWYVGRGTGPFRPRACSR